MLADGVWGRIDVTDWPVAAIEQRGRSETTWLIEPGTEPPTRWLHKPTTIPTNGVEQGEDWAEVVSTQVGQLLGVPCAPTRLCLRGNRRGSLSRNVVSDGYGLIEGYVVLVDANVPGFLPNAEGDQALDPQRPGVKRPGHTLLNIHRALRDVEPPVEFAGPATMHGFDVFVGYLILDALIGNQDRHQENWAVLEPSLTSAPQRLAPSFDHASSLGHNLSDQYHVAKLSQPDTLRKWAENGRASKFEHAGTAPSLVDHAEKALRYCSPSGADWWRRQLREINLEPVIGALRDGTVPGMSELAATFVQDLLELNLRRLRDVVARHA